MGALKRERRTLPQNASFHARLGEWATKSGQSAVELKRRVKVHMGEFLDVEVPNDPLVDRLLELVAQALVAAGKPDLMWVLPSTRSVRFFFSSAKWPKDKMRLAIETVDMMAAGEGYTLGPVDSWHDNDGYPA